MAIPKRCSSCLHLLEDHALEGSVGGYDEYVCRRCLEAGAGEDAYGHDLKGAK